MFTLPWRDDFHSTDLHPRWEIMGGEPQTPLLSGPVTVATFLPEVAEVEVVFRLSAGSEIDAVGVVDADQIMVAGLFTGAGDAGFISGDFLNPHDSAILDPPPEQDAEIRILVNPDTATLYADGVERATINTPPDAAPVALMILLGQGDRLHFIAASDGIEPIPPYVPPPLVLEGVSEIYVGADPIRQIYVADHAGELELVWGDPPVTPEGPTFLDAYPWLILPEQEGVVYSVVGMPGAGLQIEVHAAPEEGYILDGVTQWWWTFPAYDAEETVVTSTSTYTMPEWAEYLDIVVVGGGGGGGAGGGAVAMAGEGGGAGSWSSTRVFVRDHSTRSFQVTVGAGGAWGSGSAGASGSDGSSTLVSEFGLTASGGTGGRGAWGNSNDTGGESPGSHTAYGKTYRGGAGGTYSDSSRGTAGVAPGAGGGAGGGGLFGNYWNGGHGARGQVWITARTAANVEG